MDDNYDGSMDGFLEIAERLEIAGVPYFTIMVTRSQMEIPASFVRDHGDNMKPTARLRLGSGSKVWPVQIQICYSVRFRVRFCNRWRGFLSDNGLREGDELIVSLVATSEFVVYMLKRNLDPEKLSRYSLSTGTTSLSSGEVLPASAANTPKSQLRALPRNLSSPGARVEMHEGNVSDNFLARPIALHPESDKVELEKQMVVTERHAEIPENSFNGTIFFQKRMSEASTEHFGNPQFSRMEIPADFVRRHGRQLLSEDRVITLEGPKPGTSCQVVCRHEATNRRIMWRRGWHNFVTRNELRKGDDLEFSLIAPNRFSVNQLRMHKRNRSTEDLSFTIRNVNVSRTKKGSPAHEGGKGTSNALPLESDNCSNQSAAVDLHRNLHFVKTLPASSVSRRNAYPFLVVPTSFWHNVRLPPEVNLQGPKSDEIFPVKCSGEVIVGATKNLTCGWRDYANTNGLEVGDTLRFTYVSESKLFVVDYV